MLINCTNHPVGEWSAEQLTAANKWGKIKEIPFPQVSPYATSTDIDIIAEQLSNEILKFQPDAAVVQGEMTLCYALISKLKCKGIMVLAATSERKTITEKGTDGSTIKTSLFQFAAFREY
ncbi:MAG: hypothetical protein K2G63_04340 [Oscillospiraceae bacterium]|nr:hypothetical protein [Oscillospiraceae bacterium]